MTYRCLTRRWAIILCPVGAWSSFCASKDEKRHIKQRTTSYTKNGMSKHSRRRSHDCLNPVLLLAPDFGKVEKLSRFDMERNIDAILNDWQVNYLLAIDRRSSGRHVKRNPRASGKQAWKNLTFELSILTAIPSPRSTYTPTLCFKSNKIKHYPFHTARLLGRINRTRAWLPIIRPRCSLSHIEHLNPGSCMLEVTNTLS